MKILTTILFAFFFSFFYEINAQWNQINCNTQFSLNFVKIDESTGTCIAGGTQFIRSNDHGLTWQAISSTDWVNYASTKRAAVIVNAMTYVIVDKMNNNTGRITRTSNGGQNWSINSTSFTEFTDIAYNGNTMVAVGGQGMIKTSSDDGITWNTIASGTNQHLLSVDWDLNQNKWIIGGNSIRLISTDNSGSNWNQTPVPYELRDISFKNGHLVETRFFQDTNYIVQFDNTGNETNIIRGINENIYKSHLLPNNKTLSLNYYSFYEGNTNNEELCLALNTMNNFSGTSQVIINDFDVASSYGIAVGNLGGMVRFGYTNTFNLCVPADFTIQSDNTCPSTPLQIIPNYLHGDSYQWFINNDLISTSDTLFILNPETESTIKLKINYSGNETTHELTTSLFDPPIFPNYTFIVDTTLCFLDEVKFKLNHSYVPYGGPYNNFFVQLIQNNNVIYGPVAVNPNNNNHSIFINTGILLSQSDTIFLEIFKNTVCGLYEEIYPFFFQVGPNLSDVTDVIDAETGICFNDTTLNFTLNTLNGADYTIKSHINHIGNGFSLTIDNFFGDGITNLSYNNLVYSNTTYSSENTFEHNEVVVNILADISYEGCSITNFPLFNLEVSNPNAFFSFKNQNTFKGDTIQLICEQMSDSVSWSISPPVDVMQNLNDSVPIFICNTPGTYFIKMVSVNRFGCADSVIRSHVVTDTFSTANREMCFVSKTPLMKVLGNKTSLSGDYYEYGYFNLSHYEDNVNFVIRKRNSSGDLLFEIKPLNWSGYDQSIVTAIAIDEHDNLFAAVKTNAHGIHFDDSTLFTGSDFNCIIKWNSNGDLMRWVVAPYISDLDVKNGLLFGAFSAGIQTLDTNLNTLQYSEFGNFQFTNPTNMFSNLLHWHYQQNSIKLKAMPNGNVAFTMTVGNPGYFSMNNGDSIFTDLTKNFACLAIYKPLHGFIYFKKIFEMGQNVDLIQISDIAVDENNNIYLVTHQTTVSALYSDHHFLCLDSVIMFENDLKSFLLKFNYTLDNIWVKETNINYPTLNYSFGTQELYIAGKIIQNFYIGKGSNFKKINGKNEGILDASQHLNYEPFYAILDVNGEPLRGEMFGKQGMSNHQSIFSTLSNCGDIYISNHAAQWDFNDPIYSYSSGYICDLEFDGVTYNIDSNITFKLTESSCLNNCSYIVMSQPEILQNCINDTIFEISVYSLNNIDSIEYKFIGNNQIYTGFFPIINNSVLASLPNENGELILYSTYFTDTIPVGYIQSVEINTSDSVLCEGESTVLTANPIMGATYQWINDGNILNNETNNTLFVTENGLYSILYNNLQNSCQSNSIEITVNQLPTVIASASDASLCIGQETILTATGASQYSWNNNAQNGVAISPTTTTTYTVTGTDANGCTNTDDITVTVNPLPTVNLGSDITTCQNQTPVTLNAGSHTTYNWSTGATSQSIQVASTGTFSVSVTNAAGCSASDVIQVTVESCLGVEEIAQNFRIYPNPSSQVINIESEGIWMQNVIIYDLQGRMWKNEIVNGQTSQFDLSELPSGMYQIEITSEQGVHHQSITKL